MRLLPMVLGILTVVASAAITSAADPTTVEAAIGHDPSDHECAAAAPVRIRSTSARDARLVCQGAQRALRFLLEVGMQMPDRLVIEVVDRIPGELDGRAIGCYVRETRRVLLLSYDSLASAGLWLRVPIDEEVYRSAASHESAHAVVSCNIEPSRLPLGAHEYVAYVAMFATMEERLRARVLSRFSGRGLANTQQINTFVYLTDPLQFATDAWKHYMKRPDKAGWLRSLVAGQVVQEEWPTEGP